jgi:hypothetical protein
VRCKRPLPAPLLRLAPRQRSGFSLVSQRAGDADGLAAAPEPPPWLAADGSRGSARPTLGLLGASNGAVNSEDLMEVSGDALACFITWA